MKTARCPACMHTFTLPWQCGHERTPENTTRVTAGQPGGACRTCNVAGRRRRDGVCQPHLFKDDKTKWPKCGHARTAENTRERGAGQSCCRLCVNAAQVRYAASAKARVKRRRYHGSAKGRATKATFRRTPLQQLKTYQYHLRTRIAHNTNRLEALLRG